MNIHYRDLSVKDQELKGELLKSVETVLSHGRIILGPEVQQFEAMLANYCQRQFAIAVSSGTDALYLALRSLDVGQGDEVITTPMSWIATVNAIALCGATPVFVDIGEDLNLDAGLIPEAITPRTKVILPVHYTGQLCDIERIMAIANEHHITVVEDAAQAFGARANGRVAGSFGQLACFSMNPMKVYCSYGETGAVVTDDESLYRRIESLRYAGTVNREDCHEPSLNCRPDTLQAAMLLVSYRYLEAKIGRRRQIAGYYTDSLKGIVKCPEAHEDGYHIFYTYTIVAERRDELQEYLKSQGVETKIHHPILMPYHKAYQNLSKPRIPVAEGLVRKILSIPNHEDLTDREVEYVADTIREFYGGAKA